MLHFTYPKELTDDFSRTGAVPKRQNARKVRWAPNARDGARYFMRVALTLFMFMSRLLRK